MTRAVRQRLRRLGRRLAQLDAAGNLTEKQLRAELARSRREHVRTGRPGTVAGAE